MAAGKNAQPTCRPSNVAAPAALWLNSAAFGRFALAHDKPCAHWLRAMKKDRARSACVAVWGLGRMGSACARWLLPLISVSALHEMTAHGTIKQTHGVLALNLGIGYWNCPLD